MSVQTLTRERLGCFKAAYTTRYVRPEAIRTLLTAGVRPSAGDLVLARVDQVGHHARIELPEGRKAVLFPGDEIVVCYGDRYAPDQFEALVPEDLGPCHLVAGGGVAARVRTAHGSAKSPTAITPLGLLGDGEGRPLNLRDWAMAGEVPGGSRPPTIAVAGTSMNAGKTDAAAHLVRGLALAGYRVGAAKVTGTGSGGDTWLMTDAGANPVVDFTSCGHASTYRLPHAEVLRILIALTGTLAESGVDAVVLEVADGIFQDETAMLLQSAAFRRQVDGVLFAAGDALGAIAGVPRLQQLDLPVLAATGCLTTSPLAVREAEGALDVPVLGRAQLSDPAVASALLAHQPTSSLRA